MTRNHTMLHIRRTLALTAAVVTLGACELDTTNPNAATETSVLTSPAGIRAVAIGMQGRLGNALEESIFIPGIISGELGNTSATQSTTREFQDFPINTDDRAIDVTNLELLDVWVKNYAVVKSANDILENVDNVDFAPGTRAGLLALAKLHKAIAFGHLIEMFEQIPITNVPNPEFEDRATVLAEILSLLASARTDLAGATLTTEFTGQILSPGLDLLNTIRAMQARYSLAAGNYENALTFANEVPATATSVVTFTALDRNTLRDLYHLSKFYGAIRSFRDNAEPGDARVNLYTKTDTLLPVGGARLVETNMYLTDASPIPLFTQDELTLIRAEAHARATPPRLQLAIDEINIVRARAGLGPKSITDLPTQQAVLDEIYRQRTYSLFGMGLHWADQRRFGRITEAKVRYLPYPVAESSSNPNTPDNPT